MAGLDGPPVVLEREADELAAGAHAGLGEQLLQGPLHRALGHGQPVRDLLVGEAVEHERQHLPLALGELRRPGLAGLTGHPPDGAVEQVLVEAGAAGGHVADTPAQGRGRVVLQEDAGDAAAQEIGRLLGSDARRDDQNAAR